MGPGSAPACPVVIIGRDALVRRALVSQLRKNGFSLAAETAHAADAVQLAIELDPVVAIVDRDRADGDILELVGRLHRSAPGVAILLLSTVPDDEFAIRALREGASGFVSKRLPLEHLPRIVRSLAAGEAVVTRTVTMRLILLLRRTAETGAGLRPVKSELSSREWEVLDLICAGEGTRDIALRLGLSVETVRSHVKRILRKLGAHSRQEAIEIASSLLSARVRSIR